MIEDYSRQSGIKFDFTVGPTVMLREAAIPASSNDPAAARAFVAALTAPAMRERWIKAGWQPAK